MSSIFFGGEGVPVRRAQAIAMGEGGYGPARHMNFSKLSTEASVQGQLTV
jgi:hypothetical protein